MKLSEFKLRTIGKLNNLIDAWFPPTSIQDKTMNILAKTFIDANKNKYDSFLEMFCDENGELNTTYIANEIEKTIPDKIEIDIEEYAMKFGIPRWIVPNKILLLNKADILL